MATATELPQTSESVGTDLEGMLPELESSVTTCEPPTQPRSCARPKSQIPEVGLDRIELGARVGCLEGNSYVETADGDRKPAELGYAKCLELAGDLSVWTPQAIDNCRVARHWARDNQVDLMDLRDCYGCVWEDIGERFVRSTLFPEGPSLLDLTGLEPEEIGNRLHTRAQEWIPGPLLVTQSGGRRQVSEVDAL